jgi:hypothetical protein
MYGALLRWLGDLVSSLWLATMRAAGGMAGRTVSHTWHRTATLAVRGASAAAARHRIWKEE